MPTTKKHYCFSASVLLLCGVSPQSRANFLLLITANQSLDTRAKRRRVQGLTSAAVQLPSSSLRSKRRVCVLLAFFCKILEEDETCAWREEVIGGETQGVAAPSDTARHTPTASAPGAQTAHTTVSKRAGPHCNLSREPAVAQHPRRRCSERHLPDCVAVAGRGGGGWLELSRVRRVAATCRQGKV